MRKIKIGIDVGGTFTHAVAIDVEDFNICGKACVPTTHRHEQGVAAGVVQSMKELIDGAGIHPEEILLIAHSTTQATNALLEGDVAAVGIIGMGRGLEGRIARKSLHLNDIELSPGKFLKTAFAFVDTGKKTWQKDIPEIIEQLRTSGAEVFVASEVFGVDDSVNEEFVLEQILNKGYLGTAASKISRLYGLRVRTRTAVINASMMPKMLQTANMTEMAVRESGIKAPLMVMRSDGGIMDINEMRQRPILTMLSGPAAGVAAALRYVKITDGIFVEVGGTSTDISVIKNGKPQVKTAQIGKNRLFVRTLDVRTLGIAGGSVPRVKNNEFIDVGPRSAHIANLHYAGYEDKCIEGELDFESFQPIAGDPSDYLRIVKKGEPQGYAVTPTEASYYLGLVKSVGHGAANMDNINRVFDELAKRFSGQPAKLAEDILRLSTAKIVPVIKQLAREYKLEEDLITFVGGGGGASAIVPHCAATMQLPHTIAENTEVISAIGAALGIIKDSVEKNLVSPTEAELIALRQEAIQSVLRMGAAAETIEVTIEIDTQNKKVIATAYGSGELSAKGPGSESLPENNLKSVCAAAFRCDISDVELSAKTENFFVFSHHTRKKKFFGLMHEQTMNCKVIDASGTIRLQVNDCIIHQSTVQQAKSLIPAIISQLTSFGDAGALTPDIFIVAGHKLIDLTGLILESQISAFTELELQSFLPSEAAVLIAAKKK